jgi:hypothetical protein
MPKAEGPSYENITKGIWDQVNRQADVLRTQTAQSAKDQAAQAGFAPGTRSAQNLMNQSLDAQARGIGDIMDVGSSSARNLELEELRGDQANIGMLLNLAQDNPDMLGTVLQGMGEGQGFSDLVSSIYSGPEGGVNPAFGTGDILEKAQTTPWDQLDIGEQEELMARINSMDAAGIDVSQLGLTGVPVLEERAGQERLADLVADTGGYGNITPEDWQAIWSDSEAKTALQGGTGYGEASIGANFDIDISDFSDAGIKSALSSKGIREGKVSNIDGTPIMVNSVTASRKGVFDKEATVWVSGTDVTTGEQVTIKGAAD